VPTGAIVVLNGTVISGNTFIPFDNVFTQVIMPTTVVGPFNLTPPPSNSSSGGGGGPSASADIDDDDSDLALVSFVQPVAAPSIFRNGIHTVSHATATIKHDGQADLKVDNSGALLLNGAGETLVIASGDTVLKSELAHVSIKKGTIAAITKDTDRIVVRNLYETRCNSMTVYIKDKHSLQLAVGHEVVLGKNDTAMLAILQDHLIGRRKLTHHDLACGVNAASCEFSLPSLLQNSYVLHKIADSNDKADRAISSKLAKMAACLHVLGASRGAYISGGGL
jgi:hypothetical protein